MDAPSERVRVRRLPARGHYEADTVRAILEEGLLCHVGFVSEGQPFVIPTLYGLVGDRLYIHGSSVSRMLRTLEGGVPLCLTVSLVDGLVLARSAFHHSMNYRSVVVLGVAHKVEGREKEEALEAIVEHVVPGRYAEVRPPSETEYKATLVLRLELSEASAKIRTGPPLDDEEDYARTCWAGVLPLVTVPAAPVPDPRLAAGISPSTVVTEYRRPRRPTS